MLFRSDSREALLRGGESGPAVVPGKPDESLLVKALRHDGLKMPPAKPLPSDQIAALTKWVKDGLPFPADKLGAVNQAHPKPKGGVVTEESKKYWAYQPVKRPPVPAIGSKNPIDAFILAKLQEKKLEPAKPADRVTLVRRAYYDLDRKSTRLNSSH